MPLYEYVCEQCQHPFEVLLFGDEKAECPQCHSDRLARQMSLPTAGRADSRSANLPTACMSQGPPCGSMCSRFKQ